jgi:branched-chain amino acid transport system substrate-binding protein
MRWSAAALTLAVVASGCNPAIRIGVVVPETGPAAVYGSSIKSGVRLALDGTQAGVQRPQELEVVYRDSGSDPTRAASAATALYEDGALLIIGGVTSAEAKAMIPVADRMERVLLSPSASAPELTGRSRYFFRVYPSDQLEGVRAADFLVLDRRARAVLIMQEDNDYTRGLLPVFVGELKSRGARVAGSVRLDEGGWQGQARDALSPRAPDAVYVCGYGEAILGALRLLRSSGFRGTVCTTSAFSAASLLQRAGALADGVFFPLAGLDVASELEPVRSFVKRYEQIYNLAPDIYAASGYDAALVAVEAVADLADRSPGNLLRRLRGLSASSGVMGPFAFDEDGNVRHDLRIHWIHNGKVEEVGAPAPRQGQRTTSGRSA